MQAAAAASANKLPALITMHWERLRRAADWSRRTRLDVIGPVVVVGALFAVVVGNRLHTYHGNTTGFVLFGQYDARWIHPPHGAPINSPFGYDGQFFYLQATDPLLLHDATLAAFRGPGGEAFRMQRMAYPALAALLAAGQRSAIPWALLALNLIVVLAITLAFGLYARGRGWSGWWALAVGLEAGFLTGTLRDLSDPLACASMLGGLMLWQRRRPRGAAVLLSVAVLAREPMLLAVAGVAAEAALRWWRGRGEPESALRAIVRAAWPVVLVPVGAYLAWQAYVSVRYGGIATPDSAYLPPFVSVRDEIRHALAEPSLRNTLWDLAYLALMMAAIVAAATLVWRCVNAVSVTALLFGLSLVVVVFGDPWSYTRLSAPLFAALLLGGLGQRSRIALLVCTGAALLTLAMPFTPWMGAA
jgi:hypothetical protein